MQKEKNKKREEDLDTCEHLCEYCHEEECDCDEDDYIDEFSCERCFPDCTPRRRELGRGELGRGMRERSCRLERCPSKAIVGLIVLAFGVLYLGKNLAWWSFNMNWSVFWPIVVIVCGLLIIFNSRKNN